MNMVKHQEPLLMELILKGMVDMPNNAMVADVN